MNILGATSRSSKKSKSQEMRWHPLMMHWCIYIRHQSQKAYKRMRNPVAIPKNTSPGFTMEVDAHLCQSVKLEEREEWQKHIILLIDEIHIIEGLVGIQQAYRLNPNTSTSTVHA